MSWWQITLAVTVALLVWLAAGTATARLVYGRIVPYTEPRCARKAHGQPYYFAGYQMAPTGHLLSCYRRVPWVDRQGEAMAYAVAALILWPAVLAVMAVALRVWPGVRAAITTANRRSLP